MKVLRHTNYVSEALYLKGIPNVTVTHFVTLIPIEKKDFLCLNPCSLFTLILLGWKKDYAQGVW